MVKNLKFRIFPISFPHIPRPRVSLTSASKRKPNNADDDCNNPVFVCENETL